MAKLTKPAVSWYSDTDWLYRTSCIWTQWHRLTHWLYKLTRPAPDTVTQTASTSSQGQMYPDTVTQTDSTSSQGQLYPDTVIQTGSTSSQGQLYPDTTERIKALPQTESTSSQGQLYHSDTVTQWHRLTVQAYKASCIMIQWLRLAVQAHNASCILIQWHRLAVQAHNASCILIQWHRLVVQAHLCQLYPDSSDTDWQYKLTRPAVSWCILSQSVITHWPLISTSPEDITLPLQPRGSKPWPIPGFWYPSGWNISSIGYSGWTVP